MGTSSISSLKTDNEVRAFQVFHCFPQDVMQNACFDACRWKVGEWKMKLGENPPDHQSEDASGNCTGRLQSVHLQSRKLFINCSQVDEPNNLGRVLVKYKILSNVKLVKDNANKPTIVMNGASTFKIISQVICMHRGIASPSMVRNVIIPLPCFIEQLMNDISTETLSCFDHIGIVS